MELTPDNLTQTRYKAYGLWQLEGHCEPLCDGNRVIGSKPETSNAQVVHFACKFIQIDLAEMNCAGNRNSGVFSSGLLIHLDFSRIIKANPGCPRQPTECLLLSF
jgi:hypothetical protein